MSHEGVEYRGLTRSLVIEDFDGIKVAYRLVLTLWFVLKLNFLFLNPIKLTIDSVYSKPIFVLLALIRQAK